MENSFAQTGHTSDKQERDRAMDQSLPCLGYSSDTYRGIHGTAFPVHTFDPNFPRKQPTLIPTIQKSLPEEYPE